MRRHGLTLRLTVAMTGVAILVALVAGALLAPLLGSASEDGARDSLGRQADLLSRLPVSALGSSRADRVADRADLMVGVVRADGTVNGAATALSDDQVATLLAGGSVSTDGELGSSDVLLEGRPAALGGAVVVATDRAVATEATTALRRRVLISIGVGLLAGSVIATVAASRIGRPLRQTAEAARRMAAGERGVPLPTPSTSELADVADALGSLDRALASSEGRQREFLLSVSHELRTPLTSVRGYGEALADGVIPIDEVAQVGETLRDEARRLERYVDDLLALARLQSDDFALRLARVDLAALVHAAATSWRERADQSGVRVVPSAPGPVVIDTDPDRVRQVLDLLTDNAVRVCEPGAVVVLAVATDLAGVRLEVRDSGPGLTTEDAAVAFEPGVLHARYAGVRPGGHGLGLAIAHRLVSRLGGTVHVEKAPEGGAAFVVLLAT